MDRSAPIETADRFAIRRTGKKRCGYDKQCLAQELRVRGHETRAEVSVPITYKGFSFEQNLRIDCLVDNCLIVECKALDEDKVDMVRHKAQLLS